MSKFIKCWVFIICLLFIFLILFTDKVKAETCNGKYDSSLSQLNLVNRTANLGTNQYNFDLNNVGFPSNLTDATEIRGQLYWLIRNTNDTYISNVDWTSTCQNTSDYTTTYQQSYTVTYADGSTATISGRTQEIDTICTNFRTQGALTNIINFEPEITNIFMTIRDNTGNNNVCNVSSNGFFTCSLKSGITTFDRISIYIVLSKYSSADVRFGLLYNNLIFCRNDAQDIIYNNNQNAQQQHNDAQQQYNYISNTTISNENYTNTQTISDNNTNTQTKSVVMNFWLIPLNFFNSIIASFENTCTQVCVGECGNGHFNAWRFVFPCLDIKGFVGNTIYNTIDAFFAIGMIFAFVKRAKNFFINALMLTNDVASEVSVF